MGVIGVAPRGTDPVLTMPAGMLDILSYVTDLIT